MKQYTHLTASGINKLLKTASDGSKIALKEIVVSDYDGELSEQIASIPNEKYRGAINAVTIDESDSNILDVDAIIPPEVGGFYIKTAGIYCDDGSLFAVARLADTYKPLLNEGSSKDITLNFKLQIANASESVILKVDNNIVLATRKWCEKMFLKIKDTIDAYAKKESDEKFALKDDLPSIATETREGIVKLKNSITGTLSDTAVSEKAVSDHFSSKFACSKNPIGYTKLSNGLILQWGKVLEVPADGRKKAIFPIAFPTTCLNASVTYEAVSGAAAVDHGGMACLANISPSQMDVEYQALAVSYVNQPTATIYWFAIGY